MHIFAIVLSSLLLLVSPQVLTTTEKNNLQSQQQQPASNQTDQAVKFIYSQYPQLANFNLAYVTNVGRKANETSRAATLFVVLKDNQTSQASTIVTFFDDGQILDVSPLLFKLLHLNNSTAANTFNVSAGRQIAYLQAENQLFFLQNEAISPPRTFPANTIPMVVSRLSDSRLTLAMALVLAKHPQLSQYSVESIAYQIVSGINYFIKYHGVDNTTHVRAWVFVDLDMKAHFIEKKVACLDGGSVSFNCSSDLAEKIFKVEESLMLIYPQLINCNILSVVSDDIVPVDGMLFVLTYESQDKSTRTMVEVNLLSSSFNIQSYYLYSSPMN